MKPKLVLMGEDGNAYNILGKAKKLMKEHDWDNDKIDEVMTEAKSGDYDHLLQTMMKHFDVD